MTEKNNLIVWPGIVVRELIKTVLLFPVRYYSLGLASAANWAWREVLWYEKFFGVRLFWHTLFTPLYGDYTQSGRFLGFFIRLVLLIFKFIAWVFVAFLIFFAFILYGAFPLILIYLLIKIK